MNWNLVALVVGGLAVVHGAYCLLAVWPHERLRALGRIARGFAHAIDLRAPRLTGASHAAATRAAAAARRLGLPAPVGERLRIAAYLSDIGLVGVPHAVLNSPPDQRHAVEAVIAARHPEIGAAMLELVPGADDVAELVREHHLVYSDAPDRPREVHLLAAAAAYSLRAAEGGAPAARRELQDGRGTRYAEDAVDALLAVTGHH